MQSGAAVLDIGCGAGLPVAKSLAGHFNVTGIDISQSQIALARQNVRNAKFILADVMTLSFDDSSFDVIVMFYVLFHLPREEHASLLQLVHRWLKPGGLCIVTVTVNAEEPYTEDDFFGTPMYWSNYSFADYVQILTETGFSISESHVIGHGFPLCL